VWDAAASAVIGVTLVAVAVVLAVANYSLLIGEAASSDVETTIRRVAEADSTVVRVVSLSTMHVGPQDILIVLEVQFRDALAAADLTAARLQDRLTEAVGGRTNARLIVIEPAGPRQSRDPRPRTSVSA
jgi:divalent metal cation (Fe/Co/Zn/Cd) transporter